MRKILLLLLVVSGFTNTFSQVGIGTTDPNSDALLDIDATDTKGGLLMPRVELVSTTSAFPLVNHVAGMTLYNIATTAGTDGVSPGYYYNDGTKWMRLATEGGGSDMWSTSGNAGTNTSSNFIGTTDNNALRIRTNNNNNFEINTAGRLLSYSNGTQGAPSYSWINAPGTGLYYINNSLSLSTDALVRFRIPNEYQVWAMNAGTEESPFYSWSSHRGTGIYKPGANNIGFSTAGIERFRVSFRDQVYAMNSGTAALPFYSWDSHPTTGVFKPGANNIGFSTAGVERFRISDRHQMLAMDAGTAAFPSFSWFNYSGTGIYKPGNHNIGFTTGSTERMRVDFNGNVGIGTNAPSQRLQVNGNFRLQGAFMPNNNAGDSNQILLSRGANNSPGWGYKITRFVTGQHDLHSNTRLSLYFNAPGLNRNATIIANVRGDWPGNAPRVSIDYVEVQTNRFILVVSNNTGGVFGGGERYNNMDFNIMIIEWN